MDGSVCNRNCWILAAIAGVLVVLFTSGIGTTGPAGGLFLGLMTFVLSGGLLVWLVCAPRPELSGGAVRDEATGLDWRREAAQAGPAALLVSASPEIGAAADAPLPIVAGAIRAPSPEAVAVPEAPAPVAAAVVADEGRDDLRRIKGVGPKLSDWLNAHGVTRFEQIAAWDAATVAGYAQKLGRMGGRIEADDWVGQARLLARGGETAHSRAVDRGEAT